MSLITKEELERATQEIQKIQKEIRQFSPIVRADLENLDKAEYFSRVCNNHIEYRIKQAKEGDFLYQCSFYNRKYFNAKNHGRILRENPCVDVNVAGLAKFVVDCPHAGEFMCKLRDFIFKQDKDKEKI